MYNVNACTGYGSMKKMCKHTEYFWSEINYITLIHYSIHLIWTKTKQEVELNCFVMLKLGCEHNKYVVGTGLHTKREMTLIFTLKSLKVTFKT